MYALYVRLPNTAAALAREAFPAVNFEAEHEGGEDATAIAMHEEAAIVANAAENLTALGTPDEPPH